MAAWEEDFETYSGTKLFITATRPATNDETAWEGVTNWEEITITSVPPVDGRSYATSTMAVVSSGRNTEAKGSYTFGTTEFGIQWIPTQPGQITARAASLNYSKPGFAVLYPGGDVKYFSGQVSTFMESGGGSDDGRAGTLTILRQGGDTVNAVTPVAPVET